MTSERSHICEGTPSGSSCTVVGDYSFATVYMGDIAPTRSGFCKSLDASVRIEAEFCPWCGKRIKEVAK